jgi:hypothetical protein
MTTKVAPDLLDIPTVTSGTYTPSTFNGTNMSASTPYICQFLRVGSVVTVSGRLDVTPATAAAAVVSITPPVASNFSDASKAAGACSTGVVTGAVSADAANDRLTMTTTFTGTSAQPLYFHATYVIE